MAPLTQPLRDEHKQLLPQIELLRTTADSVGDALSKVHFAKEEVYTTHPRRAAALHEAHTMCAAMEAAHKIKSHVAH